MTGLQSEEIRRKFLDFFRARDHAILPSASLVPKEDPSVLFTTAGMQPLVPYLLGEPHPEGKRLVNYQRCLRTNDIEEVGDATHLTFFEMLGNWSLGDYFKQETIEWSYTLLTDKAEGFGLDPARIYITVFAGSDEVEADTESAEIWQSLGVPTSRIFYLADNWWPNAAEDAEGSGPCGPDTEIFYDVTEKGLGELSHEEFLAADDRQEVVEIWNDVFMQYRKEEGRIVGRLASQNVDTGSGLERLTAVLQGKSSIFQTDLFHPIMTAIEDQETLDSPIGNDPQCQRDRRIIADHLRAAVFMIMDGVEPSNTDAGYILRRLLRRAVQYADRLSIRQGRLAGAITDSVITKYQEIYPQLESQRESIKRTIDQEEEKFRQTLESGLKKLEKVLQQSGPEVSGEEAFKLFASYGLPVEITEELAGRHGQRVDRAGFDQAYREHQKQSQSGSAGRFKGGLAGSGSEMEVRYHTATHLLNAALRTLLGEQVSQRGSNITESRLRFDFNYPEKLSPEQIRQVEELVNQQIQAGLPVSFEELPLKEAYAAGAVGVFGESYPETVKVYTIGDEERGVFSREICGGPHVTNTADIGGRFRIIKEESISAGVRRIKAVVE